MIFSKNMNNCKIKLSAGYTLIEIMIAVLIISIGLLAYAGLQMNGLSQTHAALFRSQAAVSASDMTDRIRANLPGSLLGGYRTAETAALAKPDCSAGCTPFNLGVNDLKTWQVLLTQSLPLGAGVIACADSDLLDANPCSANSIHTIVISWDDNKDGNADANLQVVVSP